VSRVSRVFSVWYPWPCGHPQFASGDNAWCKLQITKLLTACFSPANFQMSERGKPQHTKMFISIFYWVRVGCVMKVHEMTEPRLWAEMIRNCTLPNFPGRIPILWVLKCRSVSVSQKICVGTPNIRDFPNHKNDYENFVFATLSRTAIDQPAIERKQ
jgi:hypothetical protein